MASAETNSPAPPGAAAPLGWRFVAGGLMLAVMARWVYVNHDPPATLPATVLGLAAALSLLWGGVQLVGRRSAGDPQAGGPARLLALGGAAVIGCIALWLGVTYRLEALGEVLGLAFFSLLALATGLAGTDAGWDRLHRFLAPVRFALLGLGVAALGTFIYYALVQQVGFDYAPELIGLLLGGFFLVFGGVWLLSSPDVDTPNLRLFVILMGAGLGAVLTLVSIGRGYLWNEQIFRSGLAAWSGAEAWRFWLVAYLFLGGLALIFASLSLSVSEVRSSAALRQTLFGYVSSFSVVFLLIFLALVNVLVYLKVPYTFNWSKTRGLSALSAGTKNLIAGLDRPTHFFVLMPQGHVVYSDLKNLLDNSQAYSNKLAVRYIDPDRDIVKYSELANRFKEILPDARTVSRDEESGRGVLLVYGEIPADTTQAVAHAFVPERRLFSHDFDRKGEREKVTITFKAEAELMKELDFLAQKREKRKLYFLQGDDEPDLQVSEPARPRINPSYDLAPLGSGKLAELFKKNNLEVKGLSFRLSPGDDKGKDVVYVGEGTADRKAEVPEDCHTLVILGPGAPLAPAAVDAVERYLDRGGRLLAFLDLTADRQLTQLKQTGLEGLLKKYGVNVTGEFVVRAPVPNQTDLNLFGPRRMEDPKVVLGQTPVKPATVLAKQFAGNPVHLWSPRVIRSGDSSRYKVEPLLVVNSALLSPMGSYVWTDDSPKMFANFGRYFQEKLGGRPLEAALRATLAKEPLPVAVTVSEGTGDSAKPRMVVFGDAEFMSNDELTKIETNFDLAASAVEWMSERGFVGPRPKETTSFSLPPGVDLQSMFWGAHWTMTMVLVVVGICIWIVRRR